MLLPIVESILLLTQVGIALLFEVIRMLQQTLLERFMRQLRQFTLEELGRRADVLLLLIYCSERYLPRLFALLFDHASLLRLPAPFGETGGFRCAIKVQRRTWLLLKELLVFFSLLELLLPCIPFKNNRMDRIVHLLAI